jgi:hypothetical protein
MFFKVSKEGICSNSTAACLAGVRVTTLTDEFLGLVYGAYQTAARRETCIRFHILLSHFQEEHPVVLAWSVF